MEAQVDKSLDTFLRSGLKKFLTETPVNELRKIDWLSLNPDFYIQKDKKNKAA